MAAPQTLTQLIDAGLIERLPEGAGEDYTFRHALIHDAAYASLLRADRRALHGNVGETLERDLTPAADPLDLPPRLGEHFRQSGQPERASRYFGLAGDGAARLYANEEAAFYYRSAIDSAGEADPSRLEPLALGLGQVLELSGRHGEALEIYQSLQDRARRHGSDEVERAALMARAKVHATLTPAHDPPLARRLLDEARSLARRRDDPVAESRVLWNLMVLLTWSGEDFEAAIAFGREAQDLARRAGAEEALAFSLSDLVYPLVATHAYAAARSVSEEARRLWRELGNLPMLVDGLCNAVLVHYAFGEFDAGEACAAEAAEISDRIDNLWGQTNSRLYLGQIERERGQIGRALSTMEAAITLGDRSRHPGALIAVRVDRGLLLAELGDADGGRRAIHEAEAIAGEMQSWLRAYPPAARARLEISGDNLQQARPAIEAARRALRPVGLQWSAPTLLALAETAVDLADGRAEDARRRSTELIARLEATPDRPLLSEAFRLQAQALTALGRPAEASRSIEAACASARALGARWRLWPALLDSADHLRRRGETTASEAARGEARALLRDLVSEIPDGPLRDSFRMRPDVAAVLAA